MYIITPSLQGEREREEQYFDYLEKKENIEEKMASVKELRVNVVHCKLVSNSGQCKKLQLIKGAIPQKLYANYV